MNNNKLILTPAAINKYIKSILESDKYLKFFYVAGEISNLKTHSNGNLYFSIKDNEAQINCVMFKNYTVNLGFKPFEGMMVELSGSLYENIKTGFYSINVRTLEEQGVGALAQKFNALKLKLQQEGLFDQDHKQPIKQFNQKIGVITSPTSAAVLDIISTLKRRYPIAEVIVIPTLVQGASATNDIVKKIKLANTMDFDVLIVGRGGGSIEDLWSFNEEVVARAVYESKIPIVSCVGHETDTTIIDYVADLRAPTPTAAAELVSVDVYELNRVMKSNVNYLLKMIGDKINYKKMQIEALSQNQYFNNPLLQKRLNLDFTLNEFTILSNGFVHGLELKQNNLKNISMILVNEETSIINQRKVLIKNIHQQLDNLNPLAILSRGYGVVSCDDKLIKSINDVNVNDLIDVRLNDGVISAAITKKI